MKKKVQITTIWKGATTNGWDFINSSNIICQSDFAWSHITLNMFLNEKCPLIVDVCLRNFDWRVEHVSS